MLVLDTNHFSEFQRATAASRLLRERIAAADEEFALSVVTPQEMMRGWLAEISVTAKDTGSLRRIVSLESACGH